MNTSILFMLAMVASLVGGFLALVWFSYRREAARAARGDAFAPEGKLRWGGISRSEP